MTTPAPPVIARRPSRRGRLSEADAIAALEATQAAFLEAEATYNRAVHRRGQAAHVARLRAAMSWTRIGEHLGGIRGNSAQELVGRYLAAVAEGRTLAVSRSPHQQRRHDGD